MIWIYLPTQDAWLATSRIRALTSYTRSYDPILMTGRGPLCRTTIWESRPTPDLNLHWVRGIDARDMAWRVGVVRTPFFQDAICFMFCDLHCECKFFSERKQSCASFAFELNRSCHYTSVTGETLQSRVKVTEQQNLFCCSFTHDISLRSIEPFYSLLVGQGFTKTATANKLYIHWLKYTCIYT